MHFYFYQVHQNSLFFNYLLKISVKSTKLKIVAKHFVYQKVSNDNNLLFI